MIDGLFNREIRIVPHVFPDLEANHQVIVFGSLNNRLAGEILDIMADDRIGGFHAV
jgi:hypothetical protein